MRSGLSLTVRFSSSEQVSQCRIEVSKHTFNRSRSYRLGCSGSDGIHGSLPGAAWSRALPDALAHLFAFDSGVNGIEDVLTMVPCRNRLLYRKAECCTLKPDGESLIPQGYKNTSAEKHGRFGEDVDKGRPQAPPLPKVPRRPRGATVDTNKPPARDRDEVVSEEGTVNSKESSDERKGQRLHSFQEIDVNREKAKAREKIRAIALAKRMAAQAFAARGEKPIHEPNAGESPL